MPVRGDPDPLLLGGLISSPQDDLRDTLSKAALERFDFVVLPLAAPGGHGQGADFTPSVPSDLALDPKTWETVVVGMASDVLGPSDSAAQPPATAGSSQPSSVSAAAVADAASRAGIVEALRASLETELRWAAHLCLRSVMLPRPLHGDIATFARAVNEIVLAGIVDVGEGSGMTLAVRVPAAPAEGWPAWNRLRCLCNHQVKLEIALEFSAEMGGCDLEAKRWLSEPVKYVILPSAAFVYNKNGYPVLPKKQKALLLALFKYNVQVVLPVPDGAAGGVDQRVAYVARLFQSRPPRSPVDVFSQTHLDALQAPLQPLQDHLQSQTYVVFETDPVKYVRYEEAVAIFLQERAAAARAAGTPVCAMVLGAGRGPLVAAVLKAGQRTGVELTVWAVEKNPNAVHTLRHRQRTEPGWSSVQIVACDMREWQAPRKADVIVSELLGSFSDNELSPECLDGAQRFLAEDGVSIPQNYVSSLTPVSAPRIWDDARDRGEIETLETGYVVCLHRAFYPCRSVKDCFAFHHPNPQYLTNDRFAEVAFEVEVDAVVHGFAGFFDTHLYGGVTLSIRPGQETEGMFSWFPLFIPLRVPLNVRKGDTIRSHWWRRHDKTKVWYEWALSEPQPTPIQNPGGRSWAIGL